MPQRVNYNAVAHLYDADHFREKEADPDLLAFLDAFDHQTTTRPAVLDIGCGTGSQLVANWVRVQQASLVGLDLFEGMLNQAKNKSRAVAWTQATAVSLPFSDCCLDFISNQFSFHHVDNKPAMIADVFRVLRPVRSFCDDKYLALRYGGLGHISLFSDSVGKGFAGFSPNSGD